MPRSASTVLLIHDADDHRRDIAHVLNTGGFTVLEAETAAAGLQLLAENRPGLIMLDVKLRDKSGFVLCKEIKDNPETHDISILMTSSTPLGGRDKAYGLDLGADSFLSLPADPYELVAKIRALLRVRQTQLTLKETDERLRLMVESATDYAIFSVDVEGRINSWNSGAERLYGYADHEILGKDGSVLYTDEDRARDLFRREMEQAAGRQRNTNERWQVCKNGEVFFTTGSTSPIYGASGQLIGYTQIARDITEQQEFEEKLRNSQEIFQTLASCVPAMVWMADANKSCYFFNQFWLDYTGRTLEMECDDGWTDSIHPDDLDRCVNQYALAYALQEDFEISYRLRRHDGEYRFVLERGSPHYTIENEFAGFIGACIDIHDKVLAEKKLRENETRLNLAMQGMNDGLWDLDLVKDEVYFSPRYRAMLGYDEAELPHDREAAIALIHPDDRAKAIERVRRCMSGESLNYKNVFRMKHKKGDYRWLLSRGIVLTDESGTPYRMVGAHTDITEQKELERELRDAHARAEAANTAKTNFLANMSHEIRTPMNAIIGLANLLGETPLNEKQAHMIDTLQTSAESLLALLNDLLDITKIEDDMVTLEQVPFNLRELVTRAATLLTVKAQEKNLTLDVDYTAPSGDFYIGDPFRIQQIIVNLVSNALKFTEKGGVMISVSNKLDSGSDLKRIKIKVSDTGIGIPLEKQYTIFDKFTQADNSTTRQYGGSGLGLAICKALVDHMGGNIHVTSQPDKGTTFTVNLPLVSTAAIAPKPARAKTAPVLPQDNPNNRVLLVEDYAPNVLVATMVLEALGYAYETASNGHDALDKVKRESFHAILMDIQMPGMDGFETTKQIRQWEEKNNLPASVIIAMTAHALVGDREKCLEAGMSDYISKPFMPEELQEKLSSLSAVIEAA